MGMIPVGGENRCAGIFFCKIVRVQGKKPEKRS